jgi:hypothetical protein
MEIFNSNPVGKSTSITFVSLFLLILLSGSIAAQQQSSTFTIAGWTPGTEPIFTGSNKNVVNLTYGDSLNTTVAFTGAPNDGLGTDADNIASMSFSYSYTVYLTAIGDSFSTSSSIPVGTHTISAFQTCSSGTVAPWSIGYDSQPTMDTNNVNMNISDAVLDCIPQGSYQVDIVFETYAVNSVGPNVQAIQLVWSGYANSSSTTALTTLNAPSSANTQQVAISPVTDYLFSRVAFVQVNRPESCPTLTLSLPTLIESHSALSSATVTASYPGQCLQNPCSYLWSNGETTATATNLSKGNYTVTVTAPCGNSATASVTIYDATHIETPDLALMTIDPKYTVNDIKANITNTDTKHQSHRNAPEENSTPQAHLSLYPNPASQHISFDLGNGSVIRSVRILDIVGNEIMLFNTAEQKADINIDGLQAGVYIYEVESDQTFRGKFVKQ